MLAILNPKILVPEDWIIKMDLREINCGDGKWIKLAQDLILWLAVKFTALNFSVLLPELVN